MAQRKTLTNDQVAVLRWIADGCPDGVMPNGYHHRISAAALRSRGLVTINGRGPTWAAAITTAGSEYLDEVDGPEPPIPRQGNVSVTQQLVDDVIAAGGVLRVPRKRWYDRDAIDYVRRAQLAERHGKIPEGKLLVTSTLRDEVEIRLVDVEIEASPAANDLLPVLVPERVARYHAAARGFRDHTDLHEVSRDQLQRATRVLHAVATEAQRRGWAVTPDAGAMKITAQDLLCRLTISEKGVRQRGRWEQEVYRYRNVRSEDYFWRDRELPRGAYDKDATGTLTLTLSCEGRWFAGRQGRWSDRQSWTLEERLPHLFREIEARIIHARRMREQERIRAEDAAERARRDAEQRERTWRELMATAQERLIEDHRIARLTTDVDAWDQARRIRAYCDAAEAAYRDNAETNKWIAWARPRAAARPARRRPGLSRITHGGARGTAALPPRRVERARTAATASGLDVPARPVLLTIASHPLPHSHVTPATTGPVSRCRPTPARHSSPRVASAHPSWR
jgi:hypothetical protein